MMPSRMVARLIVPEPIFQCTSSSASMNDGSTPVIHSTTPPQAIHDTVFSTARTTPDFGNATRITRTVSRITSSDSRMGTTTLNTASGRCWRRQNTRATQTRPSHSAGNSTPSKMRPPKTMEPWRGVGPRSRRGMPQATGKAAAISSSAM
jgi:hypothetical protein